MQVAESSPLLSEFARRLSTYLPTLVAGVLLLALGILVGWVVKRAVIRVLIWLRLDRIAGEGGWRRAFGKGDARAALYNGIGTIAMLLVVLIFLDNGLQILGLVVLSRMIDRVVFALPNLALVAAILGIGLILANVAAVRVDEALEDEDFPRSRLAGKLLKGVLISVVVALALWQLGIAREIVLSAFLISFGAIGIAFALAVGIGSARAIQRAWETLFEKRKEP